MAIDDDDVLTGPVPAPDAEPTAAERARARTFADLVDKALAGRVPAAMAADDRALLEVATVIRAAHGVEALPAAARRAIVEDALHQAVGGGGRAPATPITAAPRARRWAPWVIAGGSAAIAAAAVLALWLRAPAPRGATVEAAAVPAAWTSRPADALIGPIAREHAGDASARIDYLFADRLDGYRERRLSRGSKP